MVPYINKTNIGKTLINQAKLKIYIQNWNIVYFINNHYFFKKNKAFYDIDI